MAFKNLEGVCPAVKCGVKDSLMFSKQTHRDTQPFAYIGRLPIYVTTVMVALTVVGALAMLMLESSGVSPIFLFFNPVAFWKGWKFWQLFTHAFINELNFFFLFGLLCVWWSGTGIETHLGRRVMIKLALMLCIVPALMCSGWWFFAGRLTMVGGVLTLTSGLIIAYATLYPNMELWNWIPMKWAAFISIACASIQFFPNHRWPELSVFLVTCAAAHIYTRYEMGHWSLPRLALPKFSLGKRPKLRVMPKAEMLDEQYDPPVDPDLDDEVNRILDKIAKSGMSSLTSGEQEILQRARAALLKKETHY